MSKILDDAITRQMFRYEVPVDDHGLVWHLYEVTP